MPSIEKLDSMYMDIARRISQMSQAKRKKVGAILVQGDNIISYGWNGTPAGDDNCCELLADDGTLTTKPEVLHAETNVIAKLARNGGVGLNGSTLYVTLSPCFDCAKLIYQCGISRVVYDEEYRTTNGIDFLKRREILVESAF